MSTRRIEPLALGWKMHCWPGGRIDTAHRISTPEVEGVISIPDHLLLVTIAGGADHCEVSDDDGHRYVGADRAGALSFVPAGSTRRLAMKGVASRWVSVALSERFLIEWAGGSAALPAGAFTNVEDRFAHSVALELARALEDGGAIDTAYCEAMAFALAQHLRRHHGSPDLRYPVGTLPAWRLRRVADLVDAELGSDLSIARMARAVGLSCGRFHRAFKRTTGKTPLAYLHERRVTRAAEILRAESASIAEVALRVGFESPTHFARVFRRIVGVSPSGFRAVRKP